MSNGESSYRRYVSGDDEGIVEIIRDYKDGLIFYLNSILKNIEAAEEVCENTFVKIAVNKPRFRENSSFRTWLYAIGRNSAFDYLKKHGAHKNISIDECGEISADEETLENSYIKEERRIAVHRALRQLKAEYAQVLWLTYFEELSNKETAKIMRKTEHAITTLCYRARIAMKQILEKEGFEYEEL